MLVAVRDACALSLHVYECALYYMYPNIQIKPIFLNQSTYYDVDIVNMGLLVVSIIRQLPTMDNIMYSEHSNEAAMK